MFLRPVDQSAVHAKSIALASEKQKVICILDAVAEFLAHVLQLEHTIRGVKGTFLHFMQQEIHHFPGPRRAKAMANAERPYQFAALIEDHASKMVRIARTHYGGNMRIPEDELYYKDDEYSKTLNGQTTTVPVGGLGMLVTNDLCAIAMPWLDELDKALCATAGITQTDAITAELRGVKARLAMGIGRRLAATSLHDVTEDELSTRLLQEQIAQAQQRARPHAEALARVDERALRLLRQIAQWPTAPETRSALEDELALLQHVVRTPPPELAEQQRRLRVDLCLTQLERAFASGMNIQVRVELARFWADNANAGDGVVHVIDAAIAALRGWIPDTNEEFSGLVRQLDPGTVEPAHQLTLVPCMPFVRESRRFVLHRASSRKRTRLDERAERTVRLLRCMIELAGHGALQRGVLRADVVDAAATQCMLLARMATSMLSMEVRTKEKGFHLSTFVTLLNDREGDHAREIQKAACALGAFSIDELEATFDSELWLLPIVCDELTRRTREKMVQVAPRDYPSFACDALSFALPLVEQRRNALGMPRHMRTTWLHEALLTVPAVMAWSPLQGTLRLDRNTIAPGHSALRSALDALHESGVLVRRVGGINGHKRVVYEFDSFVLVAMMHSLWRV